VHRQHAVHEHASYDTLTHETGLKLADQSSFVPSSSSKVRQVRSVPVMQNKRPFPSTESLGGGIQRATQNRRSGKYDMRALRMARDGRDDESDVRDQHRNTDEVSEHEAHAMESIRDARTRVRMDGVAVAVMSALLLLRRRTLSLSWPSLVSMSLCLGWTRIIP
jgi:hypothetical protein